MHGHGRTFFGEVPPATHNFDSEHSFPEASPDAQRRVGYAMGRIAADQLLKPLVAALCARLRLILTRLPGLAMAEFEDRSGGFGASGAAAPPPKLSENFLKALEGKTCELVSSAQVSTVSVPMPPPTRSSKGYAICTRGCRLKNPLFFCGYDVYVCLLQNAFGVVSSLIVLHACRTMYSSNWQRSSSTHMFQHHGHRCQQQWRQGDFQAAQQHPYPTSPHTTSLLLVVRSCSLDRSCLSYCFRF